MTDVRTTRSRRGLVYLYCIVEAGTQAQRLLDSGQLPGLDRREPLFGVEADGIVGAVSRVPASAFGERALNALLRDLPRLTPVAVQHEAAVRALLPLAPALVPMTFGAVYRGTERVAEMLRRRGDELRRLLEQLRGKHEWSLKVLADPASAASAAEAASEALRRLDQEAQAAGPGKAYLLRKRRDQVLEAETDRLLGQAASDVYRRLATTSADARREEVSGPSGDLRLIMKAAFLVDASAADPFQAAAGELETSYGPLGLSFELSGPWAPYSFVPHTPTGDRTPKTEQTLEKQGARGGIA